MPVLLLGQPTPAAPMRLRPMDFELDGKTVTLKDGGFRIDNHSVGISVLTTEKDSDLSTIVDPAIRIKTGEKGASVFLNVEWQP